jgi:hypothetical protein
MANNIDNEDAIPKSPSEIKVKRIMTAIARNKPGTKLDGMMFSRVDP